MLVVMVNIVMVKVAVVMMMKNHQINTTSETQGNGRSNIQGERNSRQTELYLLCTLWHLPSSCTISTNLIVRHSHLFNYAIVMNVKYKNLMQHQKLPL